MTSGGKLDHAGFSGTATKEEIKEAANYIQANLHRVSLNAKYKEFSKTSSTVQGFVLYRRSQMRCRVFFYFNL